MRCPRCHTLNVIHSFVHGSDRLNLLDADLQHLTPVSLELAIRRGDSVMVSMAKGDNFI